MAQINKPNQYFNTIIYTGDGTTKTITGVGFQPDFVWGKGRNSVSEHALIDSVRGATKKLNSDGTGAEVTNATSFLTGFTSDGYTVDSTSNFNVNTRTQVNWNWLASNTSGSSNTDGTITSTVSANTTSGFSIVSYAGTGSNATVGHGLNSLPGMVIVKGRNTTSTNHWFVFHKNSQSSYSASGSAILLLNETNAVDTIGVGGVWNNTSPTSSVFNIGTASGVNESGKDFIAYCFAEKQGFSKFGSYTGNGSADGTFVFTGMKPAFVLLKNTTGDNWTMLDNKRNTYNPESARLLANQNLAEASSETLDFLSNGFKCRRTDAGENGSGITYIYMAFAEEPLVGDNPATAR